MKFKILLAVNNTVGLLSRAAMAMEHRVWNTLKSTERAAFEHGKRLERERLDKVQTEVEKLRAALRNADIHAKYMLETSPQRMQDLRCKVYGR